MESTNVNGAGNAEYLGPGQSALIEVDNVAGHGHGNPADRCQVTGYAYYDAGQWVQA